MRSALLEREGFAALVLRLRAEDGDTTLLANPRIRVKNRDKARILIGDRVPVITTTATANVGVSESVSYLDVGLKLDVEPTVSPDDEVSIKLGLEVSSLAGEVRTSGGSLAWRVTPSVCLTLTRAIARLKVGEHGLHIANEAAARRRIAGMANGMGAGKA